MAKESPERRQRGAILSSKGLARWQAAVQLAEQQQNQGRRFTLSSLSERIRVAPKTIRKVLKRSSTVDRSTLDLCFTAFGLRLEPEDLDYPRSPLDVPSPLPTVPPSRPLAEPGRIDWGEAPNGEPFYDRRTELQQLTRWVQADRCRTVALLGLGGVGKTSLAVRLAQSLTNQFDAVIWRSLRHAPPPEILLEELVLFLSDYQSLDHSLSSLMTQLRSQRCLVVLDNFDSVLQTQEQAGVYRPGYEAYGDLLTAIGAASHPSCLLLTSREKPMDVAFSLTAEGPVRVMTLTGASQIAEDLLQSRSLAGSPAQRQLLSQRYDHNPLVVKIVAASIDDLFDGDIGLFLAQSVSVFSGVRRLLDQQFTRLSELELTISYWLAINREWTSPEDLTADILPSVSLAEVLQALESLRWRCLIEQRRGRYTQQPVIMEYVVERLLGELLGELRQVGQPEPDRADSPSPWERLLNFSRYALVKTTVRDYIRQSQERLILEPLAKRLTMASGSLAMLEQQLQTVLQQLRGVEGQLQQGYGTANLLDLLIHLGIDLSDYDFSRLPIWQAYLQATPLHRVNFQGASFRQARFADVFGIVLALGFSPDGQCLALGDSGGSVRLHNATDLQTQRILHGHTSRVMSVAWSPDGQQLASASMDCTVRLWNVHTGQELAILQGHQNLVMSVSWHPDGGILATGGDDYAIYLWDVAAGCLQQVWEGHTDSVRSVSWSPDGQTLASASADGTLRLWRLATGESQVLEGHTDSLWAVEWSRDGQWLASGGEDGTIRLWQQDGEPTQRVFLGHREWIWALRFSPDGQYLASGSRDCTIRLWDLATDTTTQVLKGHHQGVSALGWHPQQPLLASGGVDQVIRLWDTGSGHALRFLQGYTTSVWSVAWNPRAAELADDYPDLASGHQDGSIWLWQRSSGAARRRLPGHSRQVWQVAWSPDGTTLASCGDDGTVQLWNVKQGRRLQTLRGHQHNRIWTVTWKGDGSLLASGGADAAIRLWDPLTQQCVQAWQAHASDVLTLQFSPDGQWLASGSEDESLRLWDLKTEQLVLTLVGHRDRITQLQFSPDGTQLASASEDRTIRIWQLSTGQCLQVLQGHDNRVWSVGFSPDGQQILSGSTDRTIRIWQLSTGTCEAVLTEHGSLIWSVDWSQDGQTLATAGEDGLVKLWSLPDYCCTHTLQSDRLYENMNLQDITGLSQATLASLEGLGAMPTGR
jgi:WD40 repeat protein